MGRHVHKDFDIASEVEVFDPRLVHKQDSAHTPVLAKQLLDSGYKFPAKKRQPTEVRRFIGWDGEGITYPGDVVQSYVLFGASTGDRIAKPSLSTTDCLDLLLSVETVYPDAIHVGFGLQYDVNMILRDLERKHLFMLYRHNMVRWNGYRLEYRPGKWLTVRKGRIVARLFDVFGFFQSSFVVACEQFVGVNDPELVGVREGKQRRQTFTYDELEPFIIPYWQAELRLLVRLMDSLRDDLLSAGLKVMSWHGPGAVANTVLRAHNIKSAKAESPQEVQRASQYAYAGGRFEQFKCGYHPSTVWEYDINSAYPTAIATLPNLARGNWRRSDVFDPESFGVWLVRHDDRLSSPRGLFTKPQPFFYRDRHGNISYPPITEGWYWTPEAAIAPSEVVRGWVFVEDDPTDKPFSFVPDMYRQRQVWKKQGNSAERALKLALNSLYGKMAQRVGWSKETGIPKWHQLEWAGYVTSTTRATLWSALSCMDSQSIIAVETDAIFSTTPLSRLTTGAELGQWEVTRFDSIAYIQSGLYYATQGETVIEKYRGFDRGSLPFDRVLSHLAAIDAGVECHCKPPKLSEHCPAHLFGQTTRFIGMGIGLFSKQREWRSWVQDSKRVVIGGGGKRAHVRQLCPQCRKKVALSQGLHTLAVVTSGGRSYPHSLPWLDADEPVLRASDELAMW